MRLRPEPITIINPDDVMVRCDGYGEGCVDAYKAKLKEASAARAVHPTVLVNPRWHAMSKAAECAFCIYRKLSIELLDWGFKTDHGWDLDEWGRLTDIKSSTKLNLLIWPHTQKDTLETKPYDILVAVYGGRWFFEPYIPEFTLYGWVTRARFLAEHLTAEAGDESGLISGTKYMRARNLDDMRTLMPGWGGYCRKCGAKGLYVVRVTIMVDSKPQQRWLWFCEKHRWLMITANQQA